MDSSNTRRNFISIIKVTSNPHKFRSIVHVLTLLCLLLIYLTGKELNTMQMSDKIYMIFGLLSSYSGSICLVCMIIAKPCIPPFLSSILFTSTRTGNCEMNSIFLQGIWLPINVIFNLDAGFPFIMILFNFVGSTILTFHHYMESLFV
jgi:hypothetical protein